MREQRRIRGPGAQVGDYGRVSAYDGGSAVYGARGRRRASGTPAGGSPRSVPACSRNLRPRPACPKKLRFTAAPSLLLRTGCIKKGLRGKRIFLRSPEYVSAAQVPLLLSHMDKP